MPLEGARLKVRGHQVEQARREGSEEVETPAHSHVDSHVHVLVHVHVLFHVHVSVHARVIAHAHVQVHAHVHAFRQSEQVDALAHEVPARS